MPHATAVNRGLSRGVAKQTKKRYLTVFACSLEAGVDNAVGYGADICKDLPLDKGELVSHQMLLSVDA